MNMDDLQEAVNHCDPVDFVKSYLNDDRSEKTDTELALELDAELRILMNRVESVRRLAGHGEVALSPHVTQLTQQIDRKADQTGQNDTASGSAGN